MLDKKLLDLLACPWCLGDLKLGKNNLTCKKCKAVYKIEDDIPNMLIEEAKLSCPDCGKEMSKSDDYAFCKPCGKRYSMIRRIEGRIEDHAEPL